MHQKLFIAEHFSDFTKVFLLTVDNKSCLNEVLSPQWRVTLMVDSLLGKLKT